ncbi:MAG: 16S rRNA (cytosine(1402)-N(4))-methyltransferase RsmH [Spirochaetaceae bacterium]|nr:MAG: 16S rRNA (cytosine(1402)-N(4))-methyltransferase RsmH [Spirochaetaceae bacterium]
MDELVHVPVMPQEVIRYLAPPEGGLVIDATLGEGGHSALFLDASPRIHLVGLDADATMLERAAWRLAPYSQRCTLRHIWFDDYFSSYREPERPMAVLFDLGISMYHFRQSGRGFALREQERLDMRLNPSSQTTAETIVNTCGEQEIADLIFRFGEERYSRRIAAEIVKRRRQAPIETAAELAAIVAGCVPPGYRYGRIHPATRTFQALRIAVNSELDRLQRALDAAIDVLADGGRLGVISFHSLEDRIVKHTFRQRRNRSMAEARTPMSSSEQVQIITRKPLIAEPQECRANPASRSAKFRVIAKGKGVS